MSEQKPTPPTDDLPPLAGLPLFSTHETTAAEIALPAPPDPTHPVAGPRAVLRDAVNGRDTAQTPTPTPTGATATAPSSVGSQVDDAAPASPDGGSVGVDAWESAQLSRRSLRRDTSGATAEEPPVVASFQRGGWDLDWTLVRDYRQQAVDRLAQALDDNPSLTEASQRELGRRIITDIVADSIATDLGVGRAVPTQQMQRRLATAVFDSVFGLGRLQPLLDDPQVEDIMASGCDGVMVNLSDGRRVPGPPIADTDEELVEYISFLASRQERTFSPATPSLDLRLPNGERLAATAWITPRPILNIRAHRLVDIGLDDLVQRDMLTPLAASFLTAAVKARKSIVVSGGQGVGKTTLVRALANAIDADEVLGTAESEFELFLHEMPNRRPPALVRPFEARPGGTERGPDGQPIGEVDLREIVFRALRFNLDRLIVGEVRGPEVLAMFKAMQAGSGSLSTTHAHHARAGVERLVTCAMEAGPHVTEDFAYRQIAAHINLLVHVTKARGVGKQHRYVSEIVAVEAGDTSNGGDYIGFSDVFTTAPGSEVAMPHTMPEHLRDLTDHGFDLDRFTGRGAA